MARVARAGGATALARENQHGAHKLGLDPSQAGPLRVVERNALVEETHQRRSVELLLVGREPWRDASQDGLAYRGRRTELAVRVAHGHQLVQHHAERVHYTHDRSQAVNLRPEPRHATPCPAHTIDRTPESKRLVATLNLGTLPASGADRIAARRVAQRLVDANLLGRVKVANHYRDDLVVAVGRHENVVGLYNGGSGGGTRGIRSINICPTNLLGSNEPRGREQERVHALSMSLWRA